MEQKPLKKEAAHVQVILTSCAAVLLVAGCAYVQPAAAPAKMSEGVLVDA